MNKPQKFMFNPALIATAEEFVILLRGVILFDFPLNKVLGVCSLKKNKLERDVSQSLRLFSASVSDGEDVNLFFIPKFQNLFFERRIKILSDYLIRNKPKSIFIGAGALAKKIQQPVDLRINVSKFAFLISSRRQKGFSLLENIKFNLLTPSEKKKLIYLVLCLEKTDSIFVGNSGITAEVYILRKKALEAYKKSLRITLT